MAVGYFYFRRRITVAEIWALRNANGELVPPVDEEVISTDCFMAWLSKEQAEEGLRLLLETYTFMGQIPIVEKIGE
jgi:hypothetical protein